MAETVLYEYWRSSASYRLRIALNLKSIAYKSVAVDLLAGENRKPAFLARNPQGFVPALEMDGMTMTQSLAIMEYLDARNPDPPFLPRDAAAAAGFRALAHAIAVDIHPVCNSSVVAHHAQCLGGDARHKTQWMHHFIARGLAAAETMANRAGDGEFLHGDAPGLADCVLVPQLYNARRWNVPLGEMPRLVAIDAACQKMEAFRRAAPDAAREAGK